MSYKAFKRLLGETSLERKCRWLLGAGVLVLMTGSFWVYAKQTEDLAYEQLETTGRALLSPIVARMHVKGDQLKAVDDFQQLAEEQLARDAQGLQLPAHQARLQGPRHQPTSDDLDRAAPHPERPKKNEETRQAPKENAYYYYGAIRRRQSCIDCHRDPAKVGQEARQPRTSSPTT